MKKNSGWKNLGAAFSLAVLWFVTVWKPLIFTTNNHYFDSAPFPGLAYLALFIDVVFLAAIFLILIKLSGFVSGVWTRRVIQIAFLVLALCAFSGLSSEILKWASPSTVNYVNVPLPAAVLFFCVAFSAQRKFSLSAITSNLKLLALFLLPFGLLVCAQLFGVWFNADPKSLSPESVVKDVPASQTSPLSQRVVWVIFDEADYAALTTAAKNNADLSDIGLLTDQSFVAKNAFPPAFHTKEAIPSLLTGKLLQTVEPLSANDATLYPKDGSAPLNLRESDNIVAEVSQLGGKIGISGWYHPYPRIFQEKISHGFWSSGNYPQCSDWSAMTLCAVDNFRLSLWNLPFMTRMFPSLWDVNLKNEEARARQVERHRFLAEKADELASNPKLDFLFFHFSVPHSPFIGRRDSAAGRESYFNSLEVVNDTIKQLREALEKAGQWDETVLIVSSDHWWREKTLKDFEYLPAEERAAAASDIRIPFMVKFAGQKSRFDYEPPFNTVITRGLILSIFKGEIKNPGELARRLDNLRAAEPELVNFRPEANRLGNLRP